MLHGIMVALVIAFAVVAGPVSLPVVVAATGVVASVKGKGKGKAPTTRRKAATARKRASKAKAGKPSLAVQLARKKREHHKAEGMLSDILKRYSESFNKLNAAINSFDSSEDDIDSAESAFDAVTVERAKAEGTVTKLKAEVVALSGKLAKSKGINLPASNTGKGVIDVSGIDASSAPSKLPTDRRELANWAVSVLASVLGDNARFGCCTATGIRYYAIPQGVSKTSDGIRLWAQGRKLMFLLPRPDKADNTYWGIRENLCNEGNSPNTPQGYDKNNDPQGSIALSSPAKVFQRLSHLASTFARHNG